MNPSSERGDLARQHVVVLVEGVGQDLHKGNVLTVPLRAVKS